MAQLWEWNAVYPDGSVHEHQTEEKAGIASEAEMLAHLTKHFPNVTITSLRQCGPFEKRKPRLGPVHRHAFTHGIWEDVMRHLGHLPAQKKESILERFRRSQLASVSGQPVDRIQRLSIRKPSILQTR